MCYLSKHKGKNGVLCDCDRHCFAMVVASGTTQSTIFTLCPSFPALLVFFVALSASTKLRHVPNRLGVIRQESYSRVLIEVLTLVLIVVSHTRLGCSLVVQTVSKIKEAWSLGGLGRLYQPGAISPQILSKQSRMFVE